MQKIYPRLWRDCDDDRTIHIIPFTIFHTSSLMFSIGQFKAEQLMTSLFSNEKPVLKSTGHMLIKLLTRV